MYRNKPMSATPQALSITYSALPGAPEEDDFLTNPDKLRDALPQPFRMLDRVLGGLFDDAWAEITLRENRKKEETERVRPPQYECLIKLPAYGEASCLASSEDGRFVFVGFREGIAALDATTGDTVAVTELKDIYDDDEPDVQPEPEIKDLNEDDAEPEGEAEAEEEDAFKGRLESIEVERIAADCYVLATLDDAACARIMAFAYERFYLLKSLNGEEAGVNRTMALKLELSKNADFAGMVVESTATAASHTQANADAQSTKDRDRDPWLEVYRLPREIWARELEAVQAQVAKAAAAADKAETTFADDAVDASAGARVAEGAPEPAPQTDVTASRDAGSPSRAASGGAGAASPTAVSVKGPGGYNFNKPVLILKIKKPLAPQPCSASSPHAALKNVDQGEALGFGANNVVFAAHLEQRKSMFQSLHGDLLRYLDKTAPTSGSPSRIKSATAVSATLAGEGGSRAPGGGTANLMMAAQLLMDRPKAGGVPGTPPRFHFLLPGLMCPAGIEHVSQLQIPNVVLVWWPGMSHVFMYSLLKSQKDTDSKPEIVIPTAAPITSTSISPCTFLLAVGLKNGTLSVWDRTTGLPRMTTSIPEYEGGGGLRDIFFLSPNAFPSHGPVYPPYTVRRGCYALALTESTRALYLLDCSMGAPTQLMQAPRRVAPMTKKEEEKIVAVKFLISFPSIAVTITRGGVITLLDVIAAHVVAQVVLPEPFIFNSREKAILTPAAEGNAIFLAGSLPEPVRETDGEVEIMVPSSQQLEAVGSAAATESALAAGSATGVESSARVSSWAKVPLGATKSGGGASQIGGSASRPLGSGTGVGASGSGIGGSGSAVGGSGTGAALDDEEEVVEEPEIPALFGLRITEEHEEMALKRLPETEERLPFICGATLEHRVASVLKSRLAAQASRHVRMQTRWSTLEENRSKMFEGLRRNLSASGSSGGTDGRTASIGGEVGAGDSADFPGLDFLDAKTDDDDGTRLFDSSISVFN